VYSSDGAPEGGDITVHYWMNRLQRIDNDFPLFVSLNPAEEIPAHLTFDRHEFDHPLFDIAAIAAQPRVQALQGLRNTWYCGAHLGHGFHEDGLASAVQVARLMGSDIPWSNDTQPVLARVRAAA
jgi:predicted NAD/FAD-binding protein